MYCEKQRVRMNDWQERLAGKTGLDWCKEEKKRNERTSARVLYISDLRGQTSDLLNEAADVDQGQSHHLNGVLSRTIIALSVRSPRSYMDRLVGQCSFPVTV